MVTIRAASPSPPRPSGVRALHFHGSDFPQNPRLPLSNKSFVVRQLCSTYLRVLAFETVSVKI